MLEFLSDAPVRACLKSIISHCGYRSCERCTFVGLYDSNSKHICLLETNCKLRTDKDFSKKFDIKHHQGTSALEIVGTNMVSDFVLDQMHLCFLGVMKRLLSWWKGVKR